MTQSNAICPELKNSSMTTIPKLKISTIITETKFIEKEIEFPYYFKDEFSNLCKIESNEYIIAACTKKSYWSLQIFPALNWQEKIAKGTPITKFEFDAAYQKAMMYVDLINRNENPSKEEDENIQIDSSIYNQR